MKSLTLNQITDLMLEFCTFNFFFKYQWYKFTINFCVLLTQIISRTRNFVTCSKFRYFFTGIHYPVTGTGRSYIPACEFIYHQTKINIHVKKYTSNLLIGCWFFVASTLTQGTQKRFKKDTRYY